MNTSTHDAVAQRAYQIWQDSGCPFGRDEEFWFEAERQLSDGNAPLKRVPATTSMVDRLRSETAAQSISEFHITPPVSEEQAVQAALQKKQARQPKIVPKTAPKPVPAETGKPLWNASRSN